MVTDSEDSAAQVRGSWRFSVKTPFGRVIASMPNRLLCRCFGACDEAACWRAFAANVALLEKAALVHLEQDFCSTVEIGEQDIAGALRRRRATHRIAPPRPPA